MFYPWVLSLQLLLVIIIGILYFKRFSNKNLQKYLLRNKIQSDYYNYPEVYQIKSLPTTTTLRNIIMFLHYATNPVFVKRRIIYT